jgi:carbohydrate kinase (thermoresistant glucokinase family)
MKSPIFVIMGVSGCGKTTVGQLLARSLLIEFMDADTFHPLANIMKMKKGIPLTDLDRQPWLSILADHISQRQNTGLVLACSALKSNYRKILAGQNSINWIYLKIDSEAAKARLKLRKNHFMPETLIQSQFEALEVPESALTIDARLPTDEIINIIKTKQCSP